MKAQTRKYAQYTIRGIPPEIDRALRNKASQLKRSLNQAIIDELTRTTIGRTRRCDFSDLVGQWTPDPAFGSESAELRVARDTNRLTDLFQGDARVGRPAGGMRGGLASISGFSRDQGGILRRLSTTSQ